MIQDAPTARSVAASRRTHAGEIGINQHGHCAVSCLVGGNTSRWRRRDIPRPLCAGRHTRCPLDDRLDGALIPYEPAVEGCIHAHLRRYAVVDYSASVRKARVHRETVPEAFALPRDVP
eukprot:scaffold325156_cov57-Tisochrysis_lutea.AAC.4